MKKNTTILAGIAAAVVGIAGVAGAAPAKRVQVDQHGDFALIGNTFGWACQGTPPAPVVGTVSADACTSQAANTGDSSPDVFWQADDPGAGQALADKANTPATARSTAVLAVPAGATVTHAYLYWGAKTNPLVAGTTVTLDRPGTGAFTQTVNAINSYTVNVGGHLAYQSVGDITAIVLANGNGAYRVSGISVENFYNLTDDDAFAGWAMIVLYRLDSDPLRDLAIFDGLDAVYNGNPQAATLTGLLVPPGGQGKLGIVAYEGDDGIAGDQFLFNGTALTDGQNPVNNFFNATRSWLGSPVSNAGDLPQLTGTAQSMAGIDIDVVNISPQLTTGMTSAPIQGTSTGDTYYLGAFVTSIATYQPDFSTSTKTAVDVTRTAPPVLTGDEIEYTISVANTGNDTATNTVLNDPLPAGVTYKPGSIKVDGVAKTDLADTDQAEYDGVANAVVVRLGAGADGTNGGTIAPPPSAPIVVVFRVTIKAGVSGQIANQAAISAKGLLTPTVPPATTVTDGNGVATPGAPPTPITVDECGVNADCTTAPKLFCKTTVSPKICVVDECTVNADCTTAAKPVCNTTASPKICIACLADGDCGTATSGKVCDAATSTCKDGCRGATFGNGCATDKVCTSTTVAIGSCVQCTADANCPTGQICVANACAVGCRADGDCGTATSGKVCDATTNACKDGCRGAAFGNGCATDKVCTSATVAIGSCVQCTADANCPTGQICVANACAVGCRADGDCGTATSGKVCDATTNTCKDGCRGATFGNGCATGKVCTSTTVAIGSCVQCTVDANCPSGQTCVANVCTGGCQTDADCGTNPSGKICDDTAKKCVDGCRGTGGNGCPAAKFCTSTTAAAGTCEVCATDLNCGNTLSGKICDTTTHTCADGCRGTAGNSCPSGSYCTSTTAAAGTCVGCSVDSNCGTTASGKICDSATHACVDGCRGTGGNGCRVGSVCTSTDATAGSCVTCVKDDACGNATSGKVCDATTHACIAGCRGTGGNGCATGVACSSTDATIGHCVQCTTDANCVSLGSELVCDATSNQCVDGCRGAGGNGCRPGRVCSSESTLIGRCGPPDVVAQGNGIACSASPGTAASSGAWLIGTLLAALCAIRRRQEEKC